jgi:hypothetical protein
MTTTHDHEQDGSPPAPLEYRISTIADFLRVPAEKQAELLRDFGAWLDLARNHVELDAVARSIAGSGVSFDTGHFTWIDDDIEGCTALDFKTPAGEFIKRLDVVHVEHVKGGAQ